MIEEQNPEPELLRIASISVEGLFGLYDHTIPLNLEDRVTIIHGPNGVGKTKILTWIAALFRRDFSVFGAVPFRRFSLVLTNGATLELEPFSAGHSERDAPPTRKNEVLLLRQTDPDGRVSEQHVLTAHSRSLVKVAPPPPDRTALLNLPPPPGLPQPFGPGHAFIGDVDLPGLERVLVHLVGAQRLLREPISDADEETFDEEHFAAEPRLAPTVDEYSRDIHRRTREALAAYARTSQSLDQSFPQRLIEHRSPAIDVEALKRRMTTLETTRGHLARLGLLDKEESSHPFDVSTLDRLEPERRLVLAVYVEDSEKKLRTLEEFAQRIQIFLDTINEKLSHKRVSLDPRAGLVAEDVTGRALELSDLSSGEQHEIVMLYDLLFNVRPNTMVLIDEPELSLHITWQKRFLDDLLQITKTVGIDALVATHSPFIVGEREDLMVPLGATPARRSASP